MSVDGVDNSLIGASLKAARETLKLSIADVSSQLHLSEKQIRALEQDDFESFGSAMLARGFIKNYARLLSLDPEPLLEIHRKTFPEDQIQSISYQTENVAYSKAPNLNKSKVLIAGAARQDKGFSSIVDLIEHLALIEAEVPFYIQSSSEHLNKSETKTQLDIARLKQIKYPKLTIGEKTLSESDYLNLFPGSICLQPYDVKDFSDRVSGVTLDSLMAGSPIVTTPNTWIAR